MIKYENVEKNVELLFVVHHCEKLLCELRNWSVTKALFRKAERFSDLSKKRKIKTQTLEVRMDDLQNSLFGLRLIVICIVLY